MSNTDASGEKRGQAPVSDESRLFNACASKEVCKLMIYRRCMVYLL